MRALVTGAEGFVGFHLIRELLSQGHEVAATHLPHFNVQIERVRS